MTETEDKIMDIVAENAQLDRASLSAESKIEELGVDSLTLVEIIFAVEESFDISVPYNANNPDASGFDLTSIKTVAAEVERLVAEQNAG